MADKLKNIASSLKLFPSMAGAAAKLLALIDDKEEIFTAALLHDVGKLVLGSFLQKDFAKIKAVLQQDVSFEAAEEMVLGTHHADMGADGARGMLAMKESGAHTMARNEAVCVVYGMPKKAVEIGAVSEEPVLPKIPRAIARALEAKANSGKALRKGGSA